MSGAYKKKRKKREVRKVIPMKQVAGRLKDYEYRAWKHFVAKNCLNESAFIRQMILTVIKEQR